MNVLQVLTRVLHESPVLGESEPLFTTNIGDALYIRFAITSPRLKVVPRPEEDGDVKVELTLIHPTRGVIDTNHCVYGRIKATDLAADIEEYAELWQL